MGTNNLLFLSREIYHLVVILFGFAGEKIAAKWKA